MTWRILGAAAALAAMMVVPARASAQTAHTKTDIIETARAAGSFNTLLAAVKAAGLEATLKGEGPFTVFAPTDEAFEALPAGTVEALLADKEKLTAILTYHVVAGKVDAAKVVTMKEAKTVNGSMVEIHAMGDAVMVNDAQVVKADVMASNGVIHVVNRVILPPAN